MGASKFTRQSATYPTALEYSNAIQTPQLCFADEELREGQLVYTAYGLPRPISGNFATVFQLQCPQRDYAVRCFTHKISDQENRYSNISHYLTTAQIPALIPFTFLSEGIKVHGKWYPLLKMAWLDGDTLEQFIATHLQESETLLELANRWTQLIQDLENAQIAHGDLQHGNILVAGNNFHLIDYDNLFVPPLRGQLSHELGHPNYQHPLRTLDDFNAQMDRFAAWVIYLSLIALAIEPRLWSLVDAGDDFLLLQQKDFLNAETSLLLALLVTHDDERIKRPAKVIEKALQNPATALPSVALFTDTPLQNSLTWHAKSRLLDTFLELPTIKSRFPSTVHVHLDNWVHWFTDLANAGHAEAQYTLGQFYLQGHGVPQDSSQALSWFHRAAIQGDIKAQYHLGQLYAPDSDTIPENSLRAAYWNGQAAQQGHRKARQIQMALFTQVAQQGNAKIQYTLALIYASKKSVPRHLKQALKWLQLAARNGHAQAQYTLAQMYEAGDDILKNRHGALIWYRQALYRGHLPAVKRYSLLWLDSHTYFKHSLIGFAVFIFIIGLFLAKKFF